MKTKNIPIPKQISYLAEAVQCDNPEAARSLVIKAFDVMNAKDDFIIGSQVDEVAIDSVISLIKGVNPQDTVEMILASQFVVTHFQALEKLCSTNSTDTSHGMMLMRLSHQALETLQKYRSKGSNINVNYFVHNEGQAVLQANIGKNPEKKRA